jgi:aminoglycoside phosphotransferase (APT) family kinase protein
MSTPQAKGRSMDHRDRDFEAIAIALGTSVAMAAAVQWGDSYATYRLDLADGRVIAARRWPGPDAARAAAKDVLRRGALIRAGVGVPWPARIIAAGRDRWTVTPWIDGPTGAAMLDDLESAATLAARMGELSQSIALTDAQGLDLDATWADPASLGRAVAGWLAALASSVDGWMADVLHADLTRVLTSWGQRSWSPVVAHGDYVPINVVIGPDGELVILDLDDLCLAPPIFDIAWWGWVVRFHHPTAWAIGWSRLLDAARLRDHAEITSDARSIGRLRCLQRTVAANDDDARARWLGRLTVTASWAG